MKFFKKVWYSIANVDKYPEMATDGFASALKYLLIFTIVATVISGITTVSMLKRTKMEELANYVEQNTPEFTYTDGNLSIEGEQPIKFTNDNNFVYMVIADTTDKSDDEINKYEDEIKETRKEWSINFKR